MSTPVTVEVEAVPIVVESTTDDYFVLYVLHDLGGRELRIPVLVALGGNGTTTLSENLPAFPKERYHLEKYLVSEPADIDGDCIDDIIELENPVGMSPINRNPVNPNSIDLIDGAMTIPDLETFNALSILHPHTGTSNFKFYIVGLDTADPSIFFFNANTHNYHSSFQNAVNIGNLTNWESLGVFFFDPNATAPDGTSGAYVFRLQPYSAYSFEVIDIAYTMLAASMPLVDNNLAYYVPAADVGYYQYGAASYNESRINVLLEDDFVSDNPFVPLNPAEGYGLLRIMDPDERPGPRDVVLYDAIPNEMPRVAGIITTAPQTPLSHVNLRAIQDGIPNAFIRDALDDDSITDLVGNYVHYTVTSSGWEMTVATQAQVNTHHASSRPAHEQILHADLSVTSITPLSEIRFEDWDAFGIKATNLAVLRTLNFTAGTTPDGFAIPFYFYDQFMKHNEFYDRINTMLADREFQTDLSTQESELKKLRKAIKKGQTPAWITTTLEEMHSQFDNNTSIRYRSSTNNEDLPGFNGAGLYDSKTQHPVETVEDGISKSLKQVYASMWNLRAFAERDFHRVNHTSTMMGVLVHPNYSNELANGVAVSFDPATGNTDTYYVNTQIGEDLVTNPEALSVPEEIKLSKTDIAFGIILHIVPGSPDQSYVEEVYRPKYTVLVTSNHMPPGTLLMSNEQMDQLRKYLSTIHDKFADLYEVESGEQFAMEIEFKITSEDSLAIKQARTWVFGNDTDANSPPTVSAGQDHVVVNGDAVSLEGITTDREGNDLTYQWTSDYSGLTIIGGDTLAPTFTAPEVDSETAIIFTLTVSDGTNDGVTDQVVVTVTDNAPPTVNAGADLTVLEGSTVTINGTASDPDEDPLTYSWDHDAAWVIEFANSTAHSTTFTAPWVGSNSTVTLTLTVDDGTDSASDSVNVTIVNTSQPPRNIGGISLSSTESGIIEAIWDAPGEAPIDYRISWTKTGEPFRVWTDLTGNAFPTGTSHTISGLEGGEEYTVKVHARYDGSAGPWSDTSTITATGTAPNQSANNLPVADAGNTQTVLEGSTVALNGTASDADPEDSLAYSWSHNSTLSISLANSGALDISFTAPNVDSDTAVKFTLTVSDVTASVSDSVIITITDSVNTAPTVNAGTDQEVTEGSAVTLAGTATDADPEDGLTYSWSHNSALSISLDDTALAPSFTAPNVSGDTAVKFTLTVSDVTASVSDSVIITITDSVNTAPTVNAGTDQEVTEGSAVTLAGTATDADPEDGLTYSWSHNSALSISLDDTALAPSFTAPNVSGDTAVKFTLTVSDVTASVSDSVIITITDSVNTAPTVNAGTDQEVTEGSAVTLAGTATDADPEDGLTYSWSHNSALSISLDDTALAPSFTAPNVSGDTAVEFTLTVSDVTASVSDSVIITITDSVNTAPTVNAGTDQEVTEGSAVTLAGTATDADPEDGLTYSWSHNSALSISLDDTALAPSFTAPNVSGDTAVEFTLTVSDVTASVSDSVIITITDSVNTAPTVNAGTDQEVTEGSAVTLAGTATDADPEDGLTYSWSHNSALSISLDDTALAPSFTAPNVSGDTAVEFTLTVSDVTASVSDSVIITITDSVNTAPTVNAGTDQEVTEGSAVTLAGNSTDNDSMTYSWRQTSGLPAVDLQGANTPSPTFTAPAVASDTVFIFEMTVNDGSEILTDTVEITIRDMPDLSYFITTWRTGTAGESITIPVGGATGTYTVDWGDGNTSVNVTGDQTHLYDDAGTHTVRISGDFTRIYLNEYPSNADKLVSIERWGDTRWESMISAFHGASNMVYRATDVPVLSDVTSMRYMFYDAQSFDGDLSGWDVSRVTDMAGAFWGASSFDADLSGWDVSRVTDMTGAFWGASSFNGDLSGWNVSPVTNMRSMFSGASSFNGDLSGWDVSSVIDMTSMFAGASSFDGNLSGWNVSRVTGMFAMFSAADSFDADLSDWDVSSVDTMSVMFRGASSFDADLSDWDVSSVDTMSVMFMDASSFDADLSDWNVSGVTDMSNMFRGASSFNGDLFDWDVSRVTDMSDMFSGAHSFNADLSSWSVSRVTDMYAMFNGAHSFNADISDWDVSRVTDMFDMFYQTNAFDQNLGKWYIVLDDAVIEGDNATGTVGRIAAQNSFLGAQNPAYGIGSGVDSASFEMDGASLRLKAVSDHLTGDSYTINVTSSGGFGTNNFRILEVPVEVSNISPATGTDINQTPLAEPAVPLVAPQNLRAASTDTTVTLTWDISDDDSITGYKILSRTPATQSQLSVLVDDTGAPGTSYVIEGLDPDTVYVFRVIAINAHGESDSSNFVRLSTDVASTTTDVASTPASAPDAPQNLLAVSTDTTVTLTWDISDDDSITGYKILSRTPATQSQLSVLVDDTGAPGTSYVIEGLDPDTVYVFRVIAINAHGESDSSNFVRLSTLP